MIRVKENIPNLWESTSWQWDANLKHWYCVIDNNHKAIVWCDWLNPPDEKNKKLSKSSDQKKVIWDGICTGIKGGPEPSPRPGPILKWIRENCENKFYEETLDL